MKILLTGAVGFIGTHFLRLLLEFNKSDFNDSIMIVDISNHFGPKLTPFNSEAMPFTFIQGDICDTNLINELVQNIDLIIHFAAETHVDKSLVDPTKFVTTNVLGTQTILEAIRMHPSTRMIHISTDEVYGSIHEGSWNEEQPLRPNSPYAASKAASDLMALSYAKTYGLDIVVTRSCNNYGPFQFPEKLIPLFITNLLEGKKVPLYGSGTNVREWIHVDDNCRAIWEIAQNGRPGEIYNIGSGIEKTNLEICHLLLDELGFDEDMIDWVPDRLGHDFRYSLDNSKLTDSLGIYPEVDFESGIRSTIDWYRSNRPWWEKLKTK